MRNRIFTFIIILFTARSTLKAQEPAFKFHLAFEDATGAKDTLWLIWDSTATSGYDAQFGEVPVSIPKDTFQVYIRYNATDTGKVKALNYNSNGCDFYICAQNYVCPINMYWDTSLIFNNNLPFEIREAYLDNNWFFFNNNWAPNHLFNMMTTDSILLPKFNYWSQDHFPMYFYMGYPIFIGIKESGHILSEVPICPNPVQDQLYLKMSQQENYQMYIRDINGNIIQQKIIDNNTIDCQALPQGLYFLELKNEKHHFIQKFIKN